MGKTQAVMHKVAEGHMLMDLHTDYMSFDLGDESHPMSGMTGPCFGAVEMKSGVLSGGGTCFYTDSGGDSVAMTWTPSAMSAEGAMLGTWSVSGGTGKWDAATGGGTFSSLTNPETGESVNTVSGAVMLP